MKHLTTAALALVLLSACGSDEEPQDALAACLEPAFDVSTCDRASLDAFANGGVYSVRLDALSSPVPLGTAMRVSPGAPAQTSFFGLQATEVKLGGGNYFLSAEYTAGTAPNEVRSRWSFAGCRALNERQITGLFRRCNEGFQPFEGTFTAERLARRAGEADSTGVDLVSETALSEAGAQATSLYVEGTRAVVVAETTGVFVFDVSDPAQPRQTATYLIKDRATELGSNTDVWSNVRVVGNSLYVASQRRGLLVFDLSNTGAPVTLIPASLSANESVATAGLIHDPVTQRLYTLNPQDGSMTILNTAPGAGNAVLGKSFPGINPGGGDVPADGRVRGDTLYLSQGTGGLVLYNAANAQAVSRLSSLPAATLSRTLDVGAVGERTYAFETGGYWGSHVRVVDVTNPASLSLVSQYTEGTREGVAVGDMALAGTRLYVANGQDGLRVLDVSNPAQPTQVAFFNTWSPEGAGHGRRFIEGATGVALDASGNVFVSDSARGLLVLRPTPTATASPREGASR
jgi:hypothetical protein